MDWDDIYELSELIRRLKESRCDGCETCRYSGFSYKISKEDAAACKSKHPIWAGCKNWVISTETMKEAGINAI